MHDQIFMNKEIIRLLFWEHKEHEGLHKEHKGLQLQNNDNKKANVNLTFAFVKYNSVINFCRKNKEVQCPVNGDKRSLVHDDEFRCL